MKQRQFDVEPSVCLPRPLVHQRNVLLHPARFKVLVCGRRWGKTSCGLQMVIRGHGKRRGQRKGAIDGGRIMWIAPNAPEITNSNIWHDIKKATVDAIITKQEAPIKILRLVNNATITVYSAREGIRGAGLDGVVVDEGAQIPPIIWQEVILPALVDKLGWAAILTTPKGLNWIYRLHESIRKGKAGKDWATWQLPSSNNPLLDRQELEDAKKRMGPRAYDQEHGAQFMEVEGAIWPADYFTDEIWADDWPNKFEISVVALDPSMGKTEKSDFQAAVFVGLARGKLWVDSLLIRRPPMELVESTDTFSRGYAADYVGCEANGFQEVLHTIFNIYAQTHKFPPLPLVPVTNTTNKVQRIQKLDPYLYNKQLRFKRNLHNETLVDQLIMFPQGEFDDGPDGLEMAIRLVNHAARRKQQAKRGEKQSRLVP